MEQKEIENKFTNEENMYFGHGIGKKQDYEIVVNSIFEQGLRTREEQLYFTSNLLGEGSKTLFQKNLEIFNNWLKGSSKESKQIIIISVPKKWRIFEFSQTAGMADRAFYKYMFDGVEQDKKTHPGGSYYVRPEFISGMYNVETREFIDNEKYYENLPETEQQKIFEEVKQKYIEAIQETIISFKEYSELIESFGIEVPLTVDEIQQLDANRDYDENKKFGPRMTSAYAKKDTAQKVEEETRVDMVELPNGIKIPRKQYEQEYLTSETRADEQEQAGFEINEFGEIIRPTSTKSQVQEQPDMVELPNGIQIPKKQYEEEQGTKKQTKEISIGEVKSSVKNGKVTLPETKKVTQDIKELNEIKKIQFMQKTGQTLTPEQKLLLEEHIRQTQQAQIQFQQMRANKKNKGKGMEM